MAGLRNLGNTCFMASSVQCLMHTPPLLRPFQDGSYTQDLNRDNPLGLHGELAEAFAALAAKLWQARAIPCGVHHMALISALHAG